MFVLVVVPALGSAYDGFRNVVIIVFANLQIVAIIGQVCGATAARPCQILSVTPVVTSTACNEAKDQRACQHTCHCMTLPGEWLSCSRAPVGYHNPAGYRAS